MAAGTQGNPARFGALYQRLSPANLAVGMPASLSMAVGAELYFADPNDVVRMTHAQIAGACRVLDHHAMDRTYHGPPLRAGFHRDPLHRNKSRELQLRALDQATRIGARKYVIHSPFSALPCDPVTDGPPPTAAAVCDELADLLEKAADVDIQVVLENMGETSPEPFVAVADRILDPRMGFCLDLAHLHLSGGEHAGVWFRALGSRLTHLHISDNDGTADAHLPFGSGTVDLSPLAAVLSKTGHGPTAVLETPVESMITSMAALEKSGLSWGADGDEL